MIVHDRYFLCDYESGQYYEVTEAHYKGWHEWMAKMYEQARPLIDAKFKHVVVFGTGGDFDQGDSNMFYELPKINPVWPQRSKDRASTYFIPRKNKQNEDTDR